MAETNGPDTDSQLDARRNERDTKIYEAFSLADHEVVLTSEIADRVNLSDRQVRRRLKDLNERGFVETRKPGRDRLWWLVEEVDEPITVQYPLTQFLRDRISVKLLAIGVVTGVASVILTLSAAFAFVFEVSSPFVSAEQFLRWSIYVGMFSGLMLFASLPAGIVGWAMRRLGYEFTPWLESQLSSRNWLSR